MICPNCKTESFGAKWCPECGFHLEVEPTASKSFDDDTKGDTQKLRPIAITPEEEIVPQISPYPPRQEERKYSPPKTKSKSDFTDRGINYWIIAIGIISVLVFVFVLFRFIGVIPTSEEPQPPAPIEEVVLENEDSSTILKAGLDQLKLANYEEAETIFKATIETDPQNTEANTLYQIVYNYNRALKKIQSSKHEEAREFYSKIPAAYANYSIRTDVENLNDKITAFEKAYADFSLVEKYMENENYEEALNIIKGIDKKYLTSTDSKTLDEYSEEIEEFLKKQEGEGENDEPSSNSLAWSDAEMLVRQYCENLVMAINNRDFSVVENNISGQLYNTQKTIVQNCIDEGRTRSFDMLEVINITEISDAKWKVEVSESDTEFYSDGTQKSQTNNRTYTIEFIDTRYYLTSVE